MIRRLNYTHRQKIRSEHVGVTVRRVSGTHPIASVTVALEEYRLPEHATVYVEAYRKASYMRMMIGTVSSYPSVYDFEMGAFPSPDGVRFRIKVVSQSEGLSSKGPVLLAVADQISPSEGGEEDAENEKLIRLVPQELNGEIWRIEFDDGPTILFEKAYWEDRSMIIRSGWFFPVVLPTVLRESLRKALEDKHRSTDEDDWRDRWLSFALTIPGETTLPHDDAEDDDIEDWINSKVEAFARVQRMTERFDPVVKRGAL